jgi:hypothetical protein
MNMWGPTSDYNGFFVSTPIPHTQGNGGLAVEKAVTSHINGLNPPKTIITK